MRIDWFSILLLIIGIWFTFFGARVLFGKGFIEKLQAGDWKEKSGTWTEKEVYKYNKTRGIRFFGSGLIIVVYAIWALFF